MGYFFRGRYGTDAKGIPKTIGHISNKSSFQISTERVVEVTADSDDTSLQTNVSNRSEKNIECKTFEGDLFLKLMTAFVRLRKDIWACNRLITGY